MDTYEIRRELASCKQRIESADGDISALAGLMVGRLRHCDVWDLASLKRELRDFNIHTKEWK